MSPISFNSSDATGWVFLSCFSLRRCSSLGPRQPFVYCARASLRTRGIYIPCFLRFKRYDGGGVPLQQLEDRWFRVMPQWRDSFLVSWPVVARRSVLVNRSFIVIGLRTRGIYPLFPQILAMRQRGGSFFGFRQCLGGVVRSRFVASFLVASLLVAPVVSRCVVARRSVLVDRSFIAARRFSRCSLIGLLGPRLLVARSSSTVRLSLLLGPRMPSQRIRGIYPLFPLIRQNSRSDNGGDVVCSKLLFFAVGVIFAGITDFRSDAFQRKYKPKNR